MLTELSSVQVHSEAEIGDIEKVRKIMKSVINSNPKNAEGWIAAARIEEYDGRKQNARNIMHQALKYVQDSDNLWLEAVRFEPPETQKGLLAQAAQALPKSQKIWQRATEVNNIFFKNILHHKNLYQKKIPQKKIPKNKIYKKKIYKKKTQKNKKIKKFFSP